MTEAHHNTYNSDIFGVYKIKSAEATLYCRTNLGLKLD